MNWGNNGQWNDVPAGANFVGIIEVSEPSNPNEPGVIGIENGSYTVNEADGTASITMLRTQGSDGVVSVDYRTANISAIAGQDYTSVSGTLTFADGETRKTVTIPITNDAQPEGAENFSFILDNITGGATLSNIDTAQINIQDNDGIPNEFTFGNSRYALTTNALTWTQAQAQAEALGGNLVTINDIIEQQVLSQNFGNTAAYWIGLNDQDNEGTFAWVSGENSAYRSSLPNQPNNSGSGEDYVVINSALGDERWNDFNGTATFRGIIEVPLNPGEITLENNRFVVNEADNTVRVQVNRTGGSNGTVTVDYQTNNGTAQATQDYNPVSGTLTFADGETSKTIAIAIVDDNNPEINESFNLIIDNASGGANILEPRSAAIEIIDNDGGGFNFPNFSNASELTLNGSASSTGNILQLTPASRSTGSAFFTEAIAIDNNTSFQTQFKFNLGGAGTDGASGFTFMLQNSNAQENALGGGGFGLGYNNIGNSIAIEFDNFDSGDFDPNNNHISVVTNGDVRNPLATANAPFDLNSGNSLNAWIEYNGGTNQLAIFISDSAVKPNNPTLTQNIDLTAFVGSRAYVGFSAAAAGNPNSHNIENWNFESTSDFITPPPVNDLLPDLQVIGASVTEGLRIDTTTDPDRVLLRFTTEVANSGDGPLEVWADDLQGNTQDVFQRIYQDDGSSRDVAAGGFSYFEPHGHSHFDDFAAFNLREINPDGSVGDIVATGDEKYSFCLINIRQPFPEITNNAAIVDGRGGSSCSGVQGISVGYSDVYNSNLENQWIDVTNVPDGTYWLETIVDPENRLLETDDSNNITRVQVTVNNPRL